MHASLSVQVEALGVLTQPLAGLQLSSVQPLSSVQAVTGPAKHVVAEQASASVQALPSSQGLILVEKTQPVAEVQLSSVHALPSLQVILAPRHAPLAQASVVHASPSSQGPDR